ncbi:hypothetical protein [Modestobacter muralis]|uniref:hypothetical protein n=1 Tax=Modestobacter muralis TaxID=1608614 RepID=UPI001B8BECA3|nr:hypothetical protein [Modestobacter muralis]
MPEPTPTPDPTPTPTPDPTPTPTPDPTPTPTPDPAPTPTPDPETFPRSYVEQLRQESAGYRTRAQQADTLAQRLHGALVAATGRLADPTDLPFDAAHLDDETALTAAIEDLIARKPHLASRRPTGDIGQGATPTGETVDLAGLLRGFAL